MTQQTHEPDPTGPAVPQMLTDLKAAGKSDEWVAAKLGVSWKTLYRWRRPKKDDGVQKPWERHLKALRTLHKQVMAAKRKAAASDN